MKDKIEDVLNFKAEVALDQPTSGYWDGGAKSFFEFTPQIERSPGPPAVRWGSLTANAWFVVEFKGSLKRHFSALRRKLQGQPRRRITIKETKAK